MMYPDPEIQSVEERIAQRRARLKAVAQHTKREGVQRLASPVVLVGASVLGFLVGGGLKRREPKYKDRRKNTANGAKVTGIASLAMTGAMWFIKARFGTPWAAAEYVLAKVKKKDSSPVRPVPSPRSDSRMGQLHR
jgi:hypothetical protein